MALSIVGLANSQAKTAEYLNEEFHPNTRTIGAPSADSQNLFRGWLMTDAEHNAGVHGKVRFMYNPPDVAVNHNAQPLIPTGQAVDPNDMGTAAGAFGELTLLLRFDRTYELWYQNSKQSKAAWEGVGHDVGCIYQLLGISPKGSSDPTQPMAMAPMHVVLGSATARAQGPAAPGGSHPTAQKYLAYYGAVTSFNVHYTSFSRQMVPRRAEVQLQLTLTTPSSVMLLGESAAADSDAGWDGTGKALKGAGPTDVLGGLIP